MLRSQGCCSIGVGRCRKLGLGWILPVEPGAFTPGQRFANARERGVHVGWIVRRRYVVLREV